MKQWELRGITVDVTRSVPPEPPVVLGDSVRALVDQLPALFWTTDRDLRFTSLLGRGLAGLGIGPNQVVGITLEEFFETDDPRDELIAAHRRAIAGETITYEFRMRGRLFHCRVAPLRDTSGRSLGTIGVAIEGPAVGAPERVVA